MASLTFEIQAGALRRRFVRNEIQAYSIRAGMGFGCEEVKYLLNSCLFFTLTGSNEQVTQAQDDLEAWTVAMGIE